MEMIKLSVDLGLLVVKQLKEKGIEPRINNIGIFSFEFTQEELDLITELTIDSPYYNCLTGLKNFRNLKKLTLDSYYYAYKKNNLSITDKDINEIAQVTSLESLVIKHQDNISWVNLEGLVNLKELVLVENNTLEEIIGLDKLKNLSDVCIYGNKELYQLPNIKELIKSNELDSLELDLLHYPEVCDLQDKLSTIVNCHFKESLSKGKSLTYTNGITSVFHRKCLGIVKDALDLSKNNTDLVILIEKYLSENILYDYDALDRKDRLHMENGHRRGFNFGTQSAYNGIMYNSCVCEGYTRAMQYLLKLLNIKTKNVYCIAGKDKIVIKEHYHNVIQLPDDGYHSIIRLELNGSFYYCDPCWDSGHWHSGDKTLPYCLKSKEEILKDHTLSFEEDNVSIDGYVTRISSDYIKEVIERSNKELEPNPGFPKL